MNKKQLVCALVVLAGQLSLVASDGDNFLDRLAALENAPRKLSAEELRKRRSSVAFWMDPETRAYNERLAAEREAQEVQMAIFARHRATGNPAVAKRRCSYAQEARFKQHELEASAQRLLETAQKLHGKLNKAHRNTFGQFNPSEAWQQYSKGHRQHRASTTTGPKLRKIRDRFEAQRAGR